MSPTHVVVDGSNIATEGRSLPSLAQLDEAVRAFLAERPHDFCTVVVDATFEHRIDPSEKQMYDEALANNELLTPPAGSIGRGDKFILEIAHRVGANVFSNDSFQEFHGEYEWLFDEGRLIGGKPVPGVGWVFIERTPVRGPKSRMATRAAGRKRTRTASGSAAKRSAHTGPTASGIELGPMPVPTTPPPTRSRPTKAPPAPRKSGRKAAPPDVVAEAAAAGDEGKGRRRRRNDERVDVRTVEPVNAPLPFIEFVAEHQPGSEVEGEVVEFSSHGAYVMVGEVRCYAPLKLLGDPTPRSAREVLTRGERRSFVVHAIHAARRGIDVGIAGAVMTTVPAHAATPAPTKKRSSTRTRVATGKTVTEAPSGAVTDTDQAPGAPGAELPESEATLAPTKKATAKKAPARKSPAKKATARKTAAKKAPAKKTTAKRATAKKATARKATKKKATAKKAPAKRKAAAKKAPAKKKAAAKKAPAKRKAAAKKAPARKKAAAKKAPARKKAAAKKAPARRKAAAKKAPAKKR